VQTLVFLFATTYQKPTENHGLQKVTQIYQLC